MQQNREPGGVETSGFDFEALRETPKESCDLIMKGGITSGVVYPRAIIALATRYRLHSIGGASAGAIAAACAAAAEFGRDRGGYEQLDALAGDVSRRLLSLFQPRPGLRPHFQALLAILKAEKHRGWVGALRVIQLFLVTTRARQIPFLLLAALLGALPGVLVGTRTGDVAWAWVVGISGALILGLLTWLVVSVGALVRTLRAELEGGHFGICSGATESGDPAEPGLTDWLHQQINALAGLPLDRPLTFLDLDPRLTRREKFEGERASESAIGAKRQPIVLRMMTTNLTEYSPYQLPFSVRTFAFKKAEFEQLFPRSVVESFCASQELSSCGEYYKITRPEEMPVVVAVRMSLSFPLLLSTVPLYARDFGAGGEAAVYRRHVFSDGGITSNLPLHFFDAPLPKRPTFGINLVEYDAGRHRGEHVWLPQDPNQGATRHVRDLSTVTQFLGALLGTQQAWLDNARLQQLGTRDRVVTIRLGRQEGGLNLAMSREIIEEMMQRGQRAGELLLEQFDFQEHKWRRFLIWSKALEQSLELKYRCFHEPAEAGPPETFEQFLSNYPTREGFPRSYKPTSAAALADMHKRSQELIAGMAPTHPLRKFEEQRDPKLQSVITLMPKQ